MSVYWVSDRYWQYSPAVVLMPSPQAVPPIPASTFVRRAEVMGVVVALGLLFIPPNSSMLFAHPVSSRVDMPNATALSFIAYLFMILPLGLFRR